MSNEGEKLAEGEEGRKIEGFETATRISVSGQSVCRRLSTHCGLLAVQLRQLWINTMPS